jgi:hypothetical protein
MAMSMGLMGASTSTAGVCGVAAAAPTRTPSNFSIDDDDERGIQIIENKGIVNNYVGAAPVATPARSEDSEDELRQAMAMSIEGARDAAAVRIAGLCESLSKSSDPSALTLTLQFVTNLLQIPPDEKFRRINTQNKAFLRRAGRLHGTCVALLVALGFEQQEGALVMPGSIWLSNTTLWLLQFASRTLGEAMSAANVARERR